MRVGISLLRTLVLFAATSRSCAAFFGGPATVHHTRIEASRATRVATPLLLEGFPDDDERDGSEGDPQPPPEEMMGDADERSEVESARAQLLQQFLGGGAASAEANPVDSLLGKDAAAALAPPQVRRASSLSAGQVLVANPERFCSRNPFSRPVKDLSRFGLQGPIDDDRLSPDMKAQMLPVLFLTEHSSSGGARALLMERRTGALMGDVSMEDYGCVAISPLWLGGTEKQNSLYVVHDAAEIAGATEISEGLYLGGWSDARPRVADSTLGEGRFKFFLGVTEWAAGQLEEEVKAGAWLILECDPQMVIKDRVADWRPGQLKPVWTEFMDCLTDEADARRILEQIYPEGE